MKLFLSSIALILLVAWLIEAWSHRRSRRRRERDREREQARLDHITGSARKWWKEPDDDLGDH